MRFRDVAFALALLALPVQAQASEALWNLLKAGGQVVIMRHAATDSTAGDRDTMRLEDCSTQRNLSASGRDDARRIGAAFRARGIIVDDARSTVVRIASSDSIQVSRLRAIRPQTEVW